jgi:sugar lactone lactonase YvrE
MKPLPLSLALSVVALSALPLHAQFPVFPAADRVIGTSDFTSQGSTTASATSLRSPSGLAIDPVSGKLFVASSTQHRILRYADVASLANGAAAEAVIGQGSYTSTTPGATATTLNEPRGLHVDGAGRLWVADYFNNRVLMFEDAANLPEFGATPDLVLGQPNFTTVSSDTSETKMNGPCSVYLDAADNLWVADQENSRVLKFVNAPALGNGAAASTVLGQVNLTAFALGASATQMKRPSAVIVDATGTLWVAEYANFRVLRFDDAASLGNGAPANGVLGQIDFTSTTVNTNATQMAEPTALALDADGTLFISDFNNNRVIYHRNPSAKANGAAADGVIGQADFNSADNITTAQILFQPNGGLAIDASGHLWVADTSHHRVLRFSSDRVADAPLVTGKVPRKTTRRSLVLKGTAADPNGIAEVRHRVGNGAFRAALGTTVWRATVRLKRGANRIELVAEDLFGNVSPAKPLRVRRL